MRDADQADQQAGQLQRSNCSPRAGEPRDEHAHQRDGRDQQPGQRAGQVPLGVGQQQPRDRHLDRRRTRAAARQRAQHRPEPAACERERHERSGRRWRCAGTPGCRARCRGRRRGSAGTGCPRSRTSRRTPPSCGGVIARSRRQPRHAAPTTRWRLSAMPFRLRATTAGHSGRVQTVSLTWQHAGRARRRRSRSPARRCARSRSGTCAWLAPFAFEAAILALLYSLWQLAGEWSVTGYYMRAAIARTGSSTSSTTSSCRPRRACST